MEDDEGRARLLNMLGLRGIGKKWGGVKWSRVVSIFCNLHEGPFIVELHMMICGE
jgi:hypothetical protein